MYFWVAATLIILPRNIVAVLHTLFYFLPKAKEVYKRDCQLVSQTVGLSPNLAITLVIW